MHHVVVSSRRFHDPRSDAELLRASATDARAFRVVYDRHAGDLLRWLRVHVDSDDVAEDLLSETFAQAWLSASRFRDERCGSARPWLIGIARHVLLESYRRRQIETRARSRLGMSARAVDFDLPDDVAERVDAVAQRRALRRAIDALPEAQRKAIALHVVGGLPYKAVAEVMGSSEPHARVRVMRGLRRLRALVGLENRDQDG